MNPKAYFLLQFFMITLVGTVQTNNNPCSDLSRYTTEELIFLMQQPEIAINYKLRISKEIEKREQKRIQSEQEQRSPKEATEDSAREAELMSLLADTY